MAKKRKGIGAIASVTEFGKDTVSLILGGAGGIYVNKFGANSPILPQYAGPIANLAIGFVLKEYLKNSMVENVGNGMIVAAGIGLLSSFGINGEINGEFINGTNKMAYANRRTVNGGIINGAIINGLIKDNAVQSDSDIQEISN